MRTRFALFTLIAFLGLFFSALHRPSFAQEIAPSDSAIRGKAVFDQKCAMCHSVAAEKKIGPGLQGFYARGTFASDGTKVTDEALVNYLHAGKGMMPPFSDAVLPPASRDDVIAYLKTL